VDPRKLKRLLDTYREAGVSVVHLDGKLQPTVVHFGAVLPPVPDGDVEVGEGADASWAAGAPMGLAQAVDKIRKHYPAKEQKGKAS
jgi:hypothetical protein